MRVVTARQVVTADVDRLEALIFTQTAEYTVKAKDSHAALR